MTAASSGTGSVSRVRFGPTPRAVLLALLVAGLLLYTIGPLRTYVAQRDRLLQLERQTQELQQENSRLAAQIHRLNDPEYLERLARERLGMVKAGEIGFVVVPRAPRTPPPGT